MRLHDVLDYQARECPEADFALHNDRRLTYGMALAEVHRLANAFVGAGLQIGDRIAMLAKNRLEYLLLYFAASKAGVVPVPLNYRLAPAEWRYMLNDAQVKVLIAAGEYVDAVDTIRHELRTVEQCFGLDGPGASGWADYARWVGNQSTVPPDRSITEDHVLYQMYTSGTTGQPKGARVTHRAVAAHMVQAGLMFRIQPGERSLLVIPVFHAGGANFVLFQSVYGGGCVYLQTDFHPGDVVRALSEAHIGVATLVPTMLQACLSAVPDGAQRRYESLRLIHYGASPIAEQTLRRALEVFRCDFVQSYGMTEVTAALTFLSPADHRRALAAQPGLLLSAGRPTVGTEVRIVNAAGEPVPNGTMGEIIAQGPQLMQGYWNLPEASAEALQGGWMHTGDAGVRDEAGYLYIQDRVKDMIVSGGENVYPRVVEEVVGQHPAVADVAVIGVPDARWGETVKAIVVLHQEGMATEEELLTFCRERLGGFECPRSVDFVEVLPRTPTGKILKRVLREPYWAGHQRRIGGV